MLIDTERILSKSEIALLAAVSPSAVSNWIRRHADFPAPIAVLHIGALYDEDQVLAWLAHRVARNEDRLKHEIRRAEERAARLRTELARRTA